MATKKIQLYRRNVDGTEILLNPLTKAKYVTMEDGSMVEEALTNQDSSKYTPNIESSKSVFKVGEGDGVDLSSSVVDGAYNSCVLKGRTLVNIAIKSSVSLVQHPTDHIVEGAVGIHFNTKPNTTYLVVCDINNGCDTKVKARLSTNTQYIQNFENGSNKKIIQADNFEHTNFVFYNDTFTTFGETTINNIMILEYQDGMENWDIPSFTGMCDVKSPILSNVGKSLCGAMELGSLNVSEGLPETSATRIRTIDYIPLQKNYYTISTETTTVVGRRYYDENKKFIINKTINTSQTPVTVLDVPSNAKFLKLTVVDVTDISYKIYVTQEAHQQGEYEPYKSNILTCETYFDEASQSDKTIVLRSLPSGVCDTLNVETGEYIQRIGELDFSKLQYNNWAISDSTLTNTISFTWLSTNSSFYNVQNSSDGVCDSIPYKRYSNEDVEHCRFNGSNPSAFVVWVSKSKLGSLDNEGLKNYLKTLSSTKVQYELATPVVKTVNLSGFPYAYKDGHVILSSGSVEQSLTPKIEYSLVANRNGQIEANTKRVLAHQKELDDFEALMLTQMVQSHYEKTLLQFDYEMSMMTLKGE